MAKGKGRPRGKQVSRETIAKAQYAKRHGLLSKQAKTTGGRLSRSVIEKVQHLEALSAVPQYTANAATNKLNVSKAPKNIAVKVSRARARDYRDRGFEVVRGQVIAPRGDKRFLEAATAPAGKARAGVRTFMSSGPDPVPQGYIEVIELSRDGIANFRDLFRALRSGKLDGLRKRADEVYSFTIFDGLHPRMGMVFFDDKELLKWLERYKAITEEVRENDPDSTPVYDGFELVRIQRGETLGPSPADARARNRKRWKEANKHTRKQEDRIRRRASETSALSKADRIARRQEQEKAASAKYRDAQRDKYGEVGFKVKQAEQRATSRAKKDKS